MEYECKKIQKTLKAIMKSKKATYESMSETLKISPATVKRRLNGDDLTIKQLKDFAHALEVSFYEVIELSKIIKREPYLFTEEQEKLLSSDIKIHMMLRLIMAGVKFKDIFLRLKITEKEARKFMRDFEKVGLAEILPGDRLNSLIHYPVRWQPDGLLNKTYTKLINKNIFSHVEKSHQPGYHKKFELILNNESYSKFCEEIDSVYKRYLNLSEIHIETQPDLNRVVSGIFFIDRFSVWENALNNTL